MDFLLQTVKGEVVDDFTFTLIEALRYQQWIRRDDDLKYRLSDTIIVEQGLIPVGKVEFVTGYLKQVYDRDVRPRNIPSELMHLRFTKRLVINGSQADVVGSKFVKSNDKIKSYTNFVDGEIVPDGNYQISEVVEIHSEWRTFVYKGKLVGLQNYSGDFTMFPDVNAINQMITAFTSAPVAYTLDVGINDAGTFVIEVHDFFSCGLYGFSDHRIYPFMLSNWYHEFLRS